MGFPRMGCFCRHVFVSLFVVRRSKFFFVAVAVIFTAILILDDVKT